MSAGATHVTVVGNVARDPELSYTSTGIAVAKFSVGTTPRRYDKTANQWADGETTWYRVIAWRQLAEHVCESVRKGMRVIVTGELESRKWENTEKGTSGVSWEITADDAGPSLAFVTAKVMRTERIATTPPDDSWGGTQPSAGEADEDQPAF